MSPGGRGSGAASRLRGRVPRGPSAPAWHFALVHGAWHGAWCWERLIGPLRIAAMSRGPGAALRGHELGSRTTPTRSTARWAMPTTSCWSRTRWAGWSGRSIAARRPLRALVYLTALVPEPGLSFGDQLSASDGADPAVRGRPGGRRRRGARTGPTRRPPRASCTATCRPRTRAGPSSACALRPRDPRPSRRPRRPPGCAWSRSSARTTAVVSPAWSRRVARERLGVEPVELPSGHFPMITHPEQLADALAQLDSE